jgi:ABC-type Fe3+ transport system substrate-binding protein
MPGQIPQPDARPGPAASLFLFFLALPAIASLAAGCRQSAPAPPAEVHLATDLPADTVEQILRTIVAQGGPRAARIPGQHLGASVLPAAAAGSEGTSSARPRATPGAAQAGVQAESGGDVRWDLEPYGAIAAANRGELAPMPGSGEDVPDLWRDPAGTWVAVGGRAQVLLVASDRLGAHSMPVRLTALTEPWLKGKVAIAAPTGGASLAHFAALYEAWGEERMNLWLSQLKANEVQVLADDAAVHDAVARGAAVVGLLGSDQAAKAKASAAQVEVVYPNQHSIGTFVWPTALSRPLAAPHPEKAAALAEKLASRLTEQLLVAREPGFLPLRRDIPVPPGVRSATNLVVISVAPARIIHQIARRRDALAEWTKAAQGK